MVEIKGLSKFFRRHRRKRSGQRRGRPPQTGKFFYALKDVNFKIDKGTILGLLGPNGAGKTTLLRVLSTAIKPSEGTATFGGIDILKDPLEVSKKTGFLSDNTGLYRRLTAREMLEYFGRLHGIYHDKLKKRVDELLTLFDMTDFADKRNDSLSSGMKQKVSIARTIIHDPEVIMLDEPTTGLDVAAALCFTGTVEQMFSVTGQNHLDKAFLALIGSGGSGYAA